MKISAITALTAAGLLAATVAMAQTTPPASTDQGTTSGPTAGSDVQPSAATAKRSRHGHHHTAKAAAASAGAPGEVAKTGSESGPAPTTPQ